ncbi:uncharacterized protein LOC118513244 isoform X1 [Anopheles stephensi]|uniref:uncharacterized protein LOC118513244 isoform X1 n=1 Tax=Anopheles stephensi TaxID=30069 RepID=UPI00165886B6|nr:uncharacterized protein LOC118513244 isoform X1 [Anopheles stephensi]
MPAGDKQQKQLQQLQRLYRDSLRSIDIYEEFVNNYDPVRDSDQVPVQLEQLEEVKNAFTDARAQLLIEESSVEDEMWNDQRTFMTKYMKVKGFLCAQQRVDATNLVASSTFQTSVTHTPLRLPEINLPSFDGDATKWLTFKDRFTSMVHEVIELPDVTKLQYLLTALKGSAATPYDHTQLVAENYESTWKSLLQRFDDSKRIKREYFKALYQLESMNGSSAEELARLVNETRRLVRGMERLNEPVNQWDTPLTSLILYKLDSASLMAWEQYSADHEADTYKRMIEFCEKRVKILSSCTTHTTNAVDTRPARVVGSSSPRSYAAARQKKESATFLACAAQTPKAASNTCPVCKADHNVAKCTSFRSMDLSQRQTVAKEARLCFSCLRRGHSIRFCRMHGRCLNCNGRHNTLLCIKQGEFPVSTSSETSALPISATLQDKVEKPQKTVWLSTALILVEGVNGSTIPARALLDMGAQSNFMSEGLVQQLKLKKERVHKPLSGVGTVALTANNLVSTTVKSRTTTFVKRLEFLVLARVTANFPSRYVKVEGWNVPSGLELADPSFYQPGSIDLLLGAEVFADMLKQGQIKLAPHLPKLLETHLGWIVSGTVFEHPKGSIDEAHIACCAVEDDSFDTAMKRLVMLEDLPTERIRSKEEEQCERSYQETTYQNEEGRYVVQLLKRFDWKTLGESKETALKRFMAMERRRKSDCRLDDAYKAFMKEYLDLKHMSYLGTYAEIDTNNLRPSFFLPHHAVWKTDSTTTKCRVVFDASCKTTSGRSLNDVLLTGPQLQDDVVSIQLRFRMKLVAVVADVEKMYRQILVKDCDKALQRILWRSDANEPIAVYELNTVTYGTACAPFLAIRTLQRIFDDHGTKFPKAMACKADFYVDDLLSGATTTRDAQEMAGQLNKLLSCGGFSLRKWASNCPEALKDIPEDQRATNPQHELAAETSSISTLGLLWTPESDILQVQVKLPIQESKCTKRQVLACIARIYDPLGFIDPVKMKAKLFMQQIWMLKGTDKRAWPWDEELPEQLARDWMSFFMQLHLLEKVRIPRVVIQSDTLSMQYHLFCDASEKGYGACCYVRSVSTRGEVLVRLMISKSKVTPLFQRMTIARLELCGALLASRLYEQVKQAIGRDEPTFLWTDSMTTWHWIHSPPSRWKTFVANRVSKIQNLTEGASWRHVPGVVNPADVVSRGCDPATFMESTSWWSGPEWLASTEENWPTVPESKTLETGEERSNELILSSLDEEGFIDHLFTRYGSYSKLRMVVGYCLRFIHALRMRVSSSKVQPKFGEGLSTAERQQAEWVLCRLAQRNSFNREWKDLNAKKPVHRASHLRGYQPFIDSNGLIRINGRLQHASLSPDAKQPIVIPKKHPLAILLAEYYHRKNLHAGPQMMLTRIRQRFWLLDGRSVVRKVFHQCVRCFRCKPKAVTQPMASLPKNRVTEARPFSVAGVDYCGPVWVKAQSRRAAPIKAFVAVFVCFITRAVHIELVSDLSTPAFLAALRRFVSRRGLVSELYSDNGTNFRGAANELHRLYELLNSPDDRREISSWCAENQISWKFIPPRTPHFGGLWEAAVRSMKHHLIRVIGNASMSYEDMTTLLSEVEACLNSRPLTILSNHPTDPEVLTPGHFLTGSHLQHVVEVDLKDVPENRVNHWRLVQKRLQHFWERWRLEYMQQLNGKHKWDCIATKIVPGTVVLLREDNVAPMKWPLAIITEVYPGSDGIVRVVKVRTAQGNEIKRPTVRICIIPNQERQMAHDGS